VCIYPSHLNCVDTAWTADQSGVGQQQHQIILLNCSTCLVCAPLSAQYIWWLPARGSPRAGKPPQHAAQQQVWPSSAAEELGGRSAPSQPGQEWANQPHAPLVGITRCGQPDPGQAPVEDSVLLLMQRGIRDGICGTLCGHTPSDPGCRAAGAAAICCVQGSRPLC
jgi:hypothetical protein